MAITHFSGPIAVGSSQIENVTAAKTLTMKDDNGKTFTLGATGKTITLPAVTNAGFTAKFMVVEAVATSDWIIASAEGDNMEGAMMVASTVVDVDAADIVTIVDVSANAENIGDWVTVFSDGTSWLVDGRALTTAAMTATG